MSAAKSLISRGRPVKFFCGEPAAGLSSKTTGENPVFELLVGRFGVVSPIAPAKLTAKLTSKFDTCNLVNKPSPRNTRMSVFLLCHIRNALGYSIGRNIKMKLLLKSNGEKSLRRMSLKVRETNQKSFVPFMDMINFRRAEARKSIVVQVQSANSFKELHSYCDSVGSVKKMFHYVVGVEPLNFIIVEFETEKDVSNILTQSSYLADSQIIPVQSQFLWFRASNRKLPKLKQSKNCTLDIQNGTQSIAPLEIKKMLEKCDSVSEQMENLYNSTKLNDVGVRLRFLTAQQVENSIKGMFPNAKAFPFGSSVNGCGKMGCDLDLVLRFSDEKMKDDARLMYHCKGLVGSERIASQRNMEAMGDLLQLFLAGCSQVRRILQARVPIIKYHQQLTDVECDLSMANMSGVHMSDFLYIMGSIDPRVRPLIFTVRKWASEIGLTNPSPGRWITNFSLTLLVIAFLQKPLSSQPILPSLNSLVKAAERNDHYVTEDGVDCTFLRDITKLKKSFDNKESLESLLTEFFQFYSQFDFSSKAVCLNEPVAITKPEHCAMYIVNPLERGLNVSKNVGIEELERFKIEARNAIWLIESQENKAGNWGILSLFENRQKTNNIFHFNFSNKQERLMEVSTLFDENKEPVEYKNETTKKQVQNIKNEKKSKLKELEKIIR